MHNTKVRMTDVHMGKRVRKSFSKINEVLDMPDLIEVQKNSYRRLIEQGLKEVLDDISPITDYNKTLALEFVGYRFDENPKYTIEECKERDADYATPLRVLVRLIRLQTGEFTESEIFIGDFPLMTPTGTFIINGTERVIVSQLVRSPGVYYARTVDKLGKELFSSTVIPNRGAWLEYETDSNDIMYVRIDRNRKLPVTVLLRAFGFGPDAQIVDLLGEDERILATIEKDTTKTMEEGLLEVYRRQRPGEPPTLDSARTLLESTFSDPKRYDLARVGRYKFNKKLTIAHRLAGQKPARDVVDPATGEVLAAAGEVMNAETASRVQNAGVNVVDVDCDGTRVRIIGNGFVDTHAWLPDLALSGEDMPEQVRFDVIKAIFDEFETTEDRERAFHERIGELAPKCIQLSDIIASISYNLNLFYGIGKVDDIDMLGNRRLRSVGELLQNQIRIGLLRLERGVRERMGIKDAETITPLELINPRPVHSAIKEFFGSSQLSQFMDQTNPLAELTHKRRMSALGPGGLNRERASFEVRDVHYSHYGRMCPIETPEGSNIGLIGSLPTYARINKYGFIETPYRVVDKEKGVVTDRVDLRHRGRRRRLYRRAGERAARRRGSFRPRPHPRSPQGGHHRSAGRTGRPDGRFAPPGRLRRHGDDPLPRKRRRVARPDGLEHAASGGSAPHAQGAHRRHRHGVQGRSRLRRGRALPRGRHRQVRQRPLYHHSGRQRQGTYVQASEIPSLQPVQLHQPAPDRQARRARDQRPGHRRRFVRPTRARSRSAGTC